MGCLPCQVRSWAQPSTNFERNQLRAREDLLADPRGLRMEMEVLKISMLKQFRSIYYQYYGYSYMIMLCTYTTYIESYNHDLRPMRIWMPLVVIHAHSAAVEFLSQARQRNPDLVVLASAWAFPAWVGVENASQLLGCESALQGLQGVWHSLRKGTCHGKDQLLQRWRHWLHSEWSLACWRCRVCWV